MFLDVRGWVLLGMLVVGAFSCGSDSDDGIEGGAGAAGGAGMGGVGGAEPMAGAAGMAEAGAGGTSAAGGSAGSSAGSAGESGTAGASGHGQEPPCSELAIQLHTADTWYFTLADMKEHATEPSDWDLKMGKSGAGPWITLGKDVQAINLGAGMTFVQVMEAPDAGYQDDPDLIGGTWNNGGAGETGYEMSNNVYVLKLTDQTFAKLAVTSAKAGAVTFDAFHQGDGSRDLACAKSP